MRAKLIDGVFTPAPRKMAVGEYIVYNPTDEQLEEAGYMEVIDTDMPDDAPEGYHYEANYSENNGVIVQSWELVESELSDTEALQIITGGAL